MTEKAGTVAKDILLEIIVLGATAATDPSEISSTMRYMNRYMTMLDAGGISLGYTTIDSVSDDITIADGAIMGLIKNVAMIIAPQYGAVISAELMKAASDGLNAMRKLSRNITPMQLPCTFPLGSGNEAGFDNDTHFYPCLDENILSEAGRNILLEDGTDAGT